MTVLKCPYCGNENIQINTDLAVGKCEYCDSTFLIPKEFDKKSKLYNRAVFLRQNKEFDKAISAYEDILKEDNTDAEAHWGILLSKYGIEYVPDEKTGEYIPTFHRTDVESLLADPDYLAALEYSDPHARNVLEQEGRRLNEIQKSILEISQKETPYDIFICYKESDNDGKRTEDSILAQDIYYELIKRDYKVFFSRKTLEHRLGEEFEPIIYSALSSAKIMVVVGTTPENFSSVWVRNEWSRFLKMSRTSEKTIIPAYRDMSPYGLPVELSAVQALDMSKIGFIQELLDGVERLIRHGQNNKKQDTAEKIYTTISNSNILSADKLIQNGDTCLMLGDYIVAEKNYQEAVKYYPEHYLGWWGLIKLEFHELDGKAEKDTQNIWEKVKQYWNNIRVLTSDGTNLKELQIELKTHLKRKAIIQYESDKTHVLQKIVQYDQLQEQCLEQIAELEKQKRIVCGQKENAIAGHMHYIKELERSNESMDKKRAEENEKAKWGKGMSIVGILLIIFFFFIYPMLTFFGILIAFFGILIAFCGFGFVLSNSGASSYLRWIDENKEKIQKELERIPQTEKKYDKQINNCNAEIEDKYVQITKLADEEKEIKDKLKRDSEKIIDFYLLQLCKEYGIAEQNTAEYRNYLLQRFVNVLVKYVQE